MDTTARVLLIVAAVMLALMLAARLLAPDESVAPPVIELPAPEPEPDPAHEEPEEPEPLARPEKLDVQGHRGARGLRPENTIAGFEEALRLGVSTLELDLGVTGDGAVVVAHDPYINPELCTWPDGERIEEERGPLLRDLTLEAVQEFDCGSLNPDPARFPEPQRENVRGAVIPTLDEVFDLARLRSARDVRFNIEIKFVPGSTDTIELEEFVETVVGVVRKYDMAERTTIQSFDWRALVIAKQIDDRLRTAAIYDATTDGPEWHAGLVPVPGEALVDLLGRLDAKVDDFLPHWRPLLAGGAGYEGGVAAFREKGIRVVPWTVNEEATMEQLIELGVDGIITDRPDLLLDLCRRKEIETGT